MAVINVNGTMDFTAISARGGKCWRSSVSLDDAEHWFRFHLNAKPIKIYNGFITKYDAHKHTPVREILASRK